MTIPARHLNGRSRRRYIHSPLVAAQRNIVYGTVVPAHECSPCRCWYCGNDCGEAVRRRRHARECRCSGLREAVPSAHCHSLKITRKSLSRVSKIHSFTVLCIPAKAEFNPDVPYVLAIVALDDGCRKLSRMVGRHPGMSQLVTACVAFRKGPRTRGPAMLEVYR